MLRYVLLAEGFAVATYATGWWSVPVVALLWGAFSIDRNRARNAALSAAGGWATLLLLDVARGSVATMATQLGGVMRVPGAVLIILTLVFPAVLAWSAAAIAPAMRKQPTTDQE